MSDKLGGVLVGLVGDGERTGIGIAFAGGATTFMPIDVAGVLFNQLGDLLENVGYFNDESDCGECTECEVKH